MNLLEALTELADNPQADGLGFVLLPPDSVLVDQDDLIEIRYSELEHFRGRLHPDLEGKFDRLKGLERAGVALFAPRKWAEGILEPGAKL